jgi:iron(III) transport system permease protein
MAPILLTVTLVLLSTLLALPLGVVWGASMHALDSQSVRETGGTHSIRWSSGSARVMLAMLVAMLALPLYIHAAGWEGVAGKFGWLPILGGGARFWFRGMFAAAWIHGMHGACWVALATWWGLSRRPISVDQISRMDARPGVRRWLIHLPLASNWIAAAVGWNAILAATEMTVADLYGVGTLADIVYKVYALDPEPFPVLAAVLVPPVIVLPVALFFLSRSRWLVWTIRGGEPPTANNVTASHVTANNTSEVIDPSFPLAASRHWSGQVFALLVPGLITFCIVFVPIASLIAKAGWTVVQTTDASDQVKLDHTFTFGQVLETIQLSLASFNEELSWSAQLALTTMVIALPIALMLAAWCETNRNARGPVMWLLLILAMIPGPVVSLLVIQFFNRPMFSFLYDRTLVPSVVAVLPRAIPAAYLVLRAGYRMLDRSVLDCAALDGCGTLGRLWSIDAARLKRPLMLAGIATFLVACGDLSATLLVLPPSVTTVASRLFGLLHSGVRQQEAGLALLATFCVASVSAGLVRLVR